MYIRVLFMMFIWSFVEYFVFVWCEIDFEDFCICYSGFILDVFSFVVIISIFFVF